MPLLCFGENCGEISACLFLMLFFCNTHMSMFQLIENLPTTIASKLQLKMIKFTR